MSGAFFLFAAFAAAIGGLFAWLAMGRGPQHDSQPADSSQVPPATAAAVPSPAPANFSAQVQSMAAAISRAEGFGDPGAIPTIAHNPGDLVLGDLGYGTIGPEKITICASDADGQARLAHQVMLMLSGQSKVYSLGDTIDDVAAKWTTSDPAAWANNVAASLGISPTTTLGAYAAGAAS
jgi:hypothetical protein